MSSGETTQISKKSAPGRPFQKGQSGNPGGRPKSIAIVQEMARKHTKLAMDTLAELAESADSDSVRCSASQALLDRGWGKAPQAITGPEGEALKLGIYIDLGGGK